MSKQETEEQRKERAQEIRRRKELIRQRRRKKKLIRVAVYALVAFLALLLILAIASIGRRIRENKAARAAEAALRQEIEQSDFYRGGEVLHLSFPVLTLDDAVPPSAGKAEAAEEESHAEEGDEHSEDEETEEPEDGEGSADGEESADGEDAEEGDGRVVASVAQALTVSDFKRILQDLYDRGYILVDIYDLAESTEEGLKAAEVMVPAGKKPLILSQQELAYRADDSSHADALVRDANGTVTNRYRNAQGVQQQGAADVAPVLEEFLATHPDFSYKGARGILGVSGENGLLGYQIVKEDYVITTIEIEEVAKAAQSDAADPEDPDAQDADTEDGPVTEEDEEYAGEDTEARVTVGPPKVNAAAYAQETPQETPAADSGTNAVAGSTESDRIITENKETIQAILGALRASGWHIASSGFGDVSYGSMAEVMQSDAEEWQRVVGPIVGTTDILLLPGKADIGSWSGYEEDDARYQLLSGLGFRYYCAENDGELTWAQIRPGYVRLGMHTIENYDAYAALMGS